MTPSAAKARRRRSETFDPLAAPLDGTLLVEASAGTGKTHALTTLFLRLVLERGLGVDQILVVTFTEAATAELRDRVRRRLRDAAAAFERPDEPASDADIERLRKASPDPRRDFERLSAALQNVDQARISTIHGFCQRVLAEAAFESGAAYDTELVGELDALRDEVVYDFFARELSDAPELIVRTLDRNRLSLRECRKLTDLVVRYPEMRVLPEATDDAGGRWFDRLTSPDAVVLLYRRLADYARSELPRRKRAKGVLSFDDLLEHVLTALRRPDGEELARSIRRRFPAALIDEFQDTDEVQYQIFSRIYRAPGTDASLFLIGDPKQAIYAFRGADVFTYLAAVERTPLERRLTLEVNHRSDRGLVEATKRIFARPARPFLFEDIELPPVTARRDKSGFIEGGGARASLEILFLRRPDGKKPLTKGNVQAVLPRLVAREIADLLRGRPTLDGRPLSAGDVAVLTRTNQQAFDVQEALRELELPSVVLGDSSVFERPESRELEWLLAGIADPTDSRALRAALTTDLLGVNAAELVAMDSDARAWDGWVNDFRRWNELWEQRGFVQMFRAVLGSRGVQERVLAREDGERRMTNLLHLMELCHTATRENKLGPAGLLHWLHQQRTQAESDPAWVEAAQIRLERDERAVKLLTIHRSKGLEFPVVYCPYLWDGFLLFRNENKQLLLFHDPSDRKLVLDLDPRELGHGANVAAAKWERFAENLRLTYVALTRAKHRCSLVWGAIGKDQTSALGYLLHWPSGKELPGTNVDAIAKELRRLDDASMLEDLRELEAAAEGAIVLRELDTNRRGKPLEDAAPGAGSLEARKVAGRIDRWWRTASFSALSSGETRLGGQPGSAISESTELPGEEGRDRDELAVDPSPTSRADTGPRILLADFPRGAKAGNFFHEVLEGFDFEEKRGEALPAVVEKKLLDYGYDAALWAGPVCEAIRSMLETPLETESGAVRLRQVSWQRRLNELEFYLPVSEAGHDEWFTRATLASAFRAHPSRELPAAYVERLRGLDFVPLKGWLKGFIDLVFEADGRYYLIDYKTNHLGDHAGAYARERLGAAMAHSHYFLQYHLYAVALHRHLGRRLPGYDYDRHFGGAYYLFLKGMSPELGSSSGVFFDKPPRARIETLSAQLSRPARAKA